MVRAKRPGALLSAPALQARWRPAAAVTLVAALVGCSPPAPGDPKGPYASPTPGPAQQVINRGCSNAAHQEPEATDVGFMQTVLVRQQANLQRVSDDLTGAVPGGNPGTDTALAEANAHQLVDLVTRSTIYSPFREQLAAAALSLASADQALVTAAGGGDLPTALQNARAAFQALTALAGRPPAAAASPR